MGSIIRGRVRVGRGEHWSRATMKTNNFFAEKYASLEEDENAIRREKGKDPSTERILGVLGFRILRGSPPIKKVWRTPTEGGSEIKVIKACYYPTKGSEINTVAKGERRRGLSGKKKER